jgi:hypothetical protein
LFLWSAALQGQLLKLDEDKLSEDMDTHQQQQAVSNGAVAAAADGSSQLLTEQVKPKQGLPPLLVNPGER